MRSLRPTLLPLVALLAGTVLASCDAYPTIPGPPLGAPNNSWGIVRFAFGDHPADTLSVIVSHGPTLEAARAYVRTQRGPRIPVGPIVRGAGIDGRYPFHFVADSVRLVESASGGCDAAFMYTPTDVEEFFRTTVGSAEAARARWCPSSAYPVSVE